MTETGRYIAIDLKSFYASVECVERGLDPLNDNLVVADESRTDKTICLAVSPSLKAYGISGRARLFEVIQAVRRINRQRREAINGQAFRGRSYHSDELAKDPYLELDYVVAVPRMSFYIEYSTRIYDTYLKYIAPEDIHVYSIDEVFINAGPYLNTYHVSAHELALLMVRDVLHTTGITATAGIGPNLYLCKIAMDIEAKHSPADADGVRIAELDEMSYRRLLWNHRPLTDFWRVGHGTAKRLSAYGLDTMGKIARCSLRNEELLYGLFGVNAELLIDHAWGWEPCTIALVKQYRPESNSFSSGQVLKEPYSCKKARVVLLEMAESMALSLVEKRMVTDQVVVDVGYDAESLTRPEIRAKYKGDVSTDRYGRKVPKRVHGSAGLQPPTASSQRIAEAVMKTYDQIVNPDLLVRYLNLTVNHVVDENAVGRRDEGVQLDMFTDYEAVERQKRAEAAALAKERRLQEAQLAIKRKFGKNAILKGTSFEEGATAIERNSQIGGHKA